MITVFFGWKFFNFIIIPKEFEIPLISEVEITLLSILIQCGFSTDYINIIIKIIINKLSLTNKFIILDNPICILKKYTNYLNIFNRLFVDFLNIKKINIDKTDISIITLKNRNLYPLESYNNYLYNITTKKYDIKNIFTLDSEVTEILPINLKNILYIPHLFILNNTTTGYSSTNISIRYVWQKRKLHYEKYTLIDLSINDIVPFIINYNNHKNKSYITHLSGGSAIIFQRTINFILELYNLDLLDTYIIESSYDLLIKYKCVKILYLHAPPLTKNSKSYLSNFHIKMNIDELVIESDNYYNILQERIRKELLICTNIIDNKLKIKLDNKSNLKKYINDTSILPLTFNIGPISNLLSEDENKELLIQYDYVKYIIIKIIKFIKNYCKFYKDKFFIIKDADGTSGQNITGFNCVDDYDTINYQNKISYLTNLFTKENILMHQLRMGSNSEFEHRQNINNFLNRELVIQEFIQSPSIDYQGTKYNYKSRIYVIVYQKKSENDNISQLYTYIYKEFVLDLMNYSKINSKNFYNETGNDKLFISNSLNINIQSNKFKLHQFSFNPNEKLKEFIDKFNIHINKINKFFDGIFIDENYQFVNNNIYKILSIDIIFDINDNNNIKILEINTEGGQYIDVIEKGILKLIYFNDDSYFIKADTLFNYDEEVIYSNSFDDIYCINKFNETEQSKLSLKNKYIKYKNKYLNIKNNL